MKIIKRNGSEVPFDITKIITAVTKASDSVSRKSSRPRSRSCPSPTMSRTSARR